MCNTKLVIEKIATPGTTDSSRPERGKLMTLCETEDIIWQKYLSMNYFIPFKKIYTTVEYVF